MNNIIIRAISYLRHDRSYFFDALIAHLGIWLPDEPYLRLRFRFKMGYWLNLDTPKTFIEKINWLKLHNRKPEYTQMVDKLAVKTYVMQKIGAEYIIPTIGIWSNPEDINFDSLPEQFVLKTTHGGGSCGVVVCKNKSIFDKKAAVSKLRNSMDSDMYKVYREWPYKYVKKQIIAEPYMVPIAQKDNPLYDLTDYKFYCFNGIPLYCQVIRNRHTNESIDFYDMNWNHMDFIGLNSKCMNGTTAVPRPTRLEDMKNVCRQLSGEIPFLRVDLYEIDGRLFFGEITFFPAAGIGEIAPSIWDQKLGELIKIDRYA